MFELISFLISLYQSGPNVTWGEHTPPDPEHRVYPKPRRGRRVRARDQPCYGEVGGIQSRVIWSDNKLGTPNKLPGRRSRSSRDRAYRGAYCGAYCGALWSPGGLELT